MTIRSILPVVLVATFAAATLDGVVWTASAQEADIESIYQQYLDARWAGEIDGALAFMAEDAVYNDLRGRDAIRAELEAQRADNAAATVRSMEVMGSTVHVEWEYTSSCYEQSGLVLHGSSVVEFEGGLIAHYQVTPALAALSDTQLQQLAEAVACQQALGFPLAGAGPVPGAAPTWWYLAAAGAALAAAGLIAAGANRRPR
jgi:hypothetical protein